MKYVIHTLSFLLICLFCACTDVTLSYNPQALNRHILGYWQSADGSTLGFKENISREVFQSTYSFDARKQEFVRSGDALRVYFIDMSIYGRNYQFLSIEYTDSTFSNLSYSFTASGNLELKTINTSLPYKHSMKNSDNDFFGTPQNLQQYVRENIGVAGFFEKTEQFRPR